MGPGPGKIDLHFLMLNLHTATHVGTQTGTIKLNWSRSRSRKGSVWISRKYLLWIYFPRHGFSFVFLILPNQPSETLLCNSLGWKGTCKMTNDPSKHNINKIYFKQDWIPVGCVPPARWPYLPACSAPGVSAPGGICSGGGGGGVCSGGGCLLRGVYLVPGGCTWSGTPPVDRHSPVNILPCPKLRLRAVITDRTNPGIQTSEIIRHLLPMVFSNISNVYLSILFVLSTWIVKIAWDLLDVEFIAVAPVVLPWDPSSRHFIVSSSSRTVVSFRPVIWFNV